MTRVRSGRNPSIGETIQITASTVLTLEQVTEALEQGYISPLNYDGKHPEPTPPTDETQPRKVVSLGDYQERIESKKDRLEARPTTDSFVKRLGKDALIDIALPVMSETSLQIADRSAEGVFR